MPLLLLVSSLYSAWILKSWNFCFETRLLACGVFVIAPSTTVQPDGLVWSCTPQASIDMPSKRSIGLPSLWAAFASDGGHFGGRAPVNSIVRAGVLMVPASVLPFIRARYSGAGPRAGAVPW